MRCAQCRNQICKKDDKFKELECSRESIRNFFFKGETSGPFTILEPQDREMCKFQIAEERLETDFEASKVAKGSVGTWWKSELDMRRLSGWIESASRILTFNKSSSLGQAANAIYPTEKFTILVTHNPPINVCEPHSKSDGRWFVWSNCELFDRVRIYVSSELGSKDAVRLSVPSSPYAGPFIILEPQGNFAI